MFLAWEGGVSMGGGKLFEGGNRHHLGILRGFVSGGPAERSFAEA